ncbi:MAG: ATP-binding protein [Haliea sp.]
MITEQEKQLCLVVADNGKGIPQAALPKLFDPFYCVNNTSHRGTQGTGLGLGLGLATLLCLVSQLKADNVQSLDVGMELLWKSLAVGRNETHFMAIFLSSFSLLLFYAFLYRASLLPRWLRGFANLACVLQLIAIGNTFFQGQVLVLLHLPLLLTQIVVPVYLIVFDTPLPATTEPTAPMPMNQRC